MESHVGGRHGVDDYHLTSRPRWLLPSIPIQTTAILSVMERQAIVDFVVNVAGGLCHDYPVLVRLTSQLYVRRFFTVKDVEEFTQIADLLVEAATAVYLAGKVEELPPVGKEYDMRQRGVHVERMCNEMVDRYPGWFSPTQLLAKIIEHESEFMETLGFDLWCYHPLRPALYVMAEIGLDDNVRTTVHELILNIYAFGSLTLIWPPSALATAAVMCVMRWKKIENEERVLKHVLDIIGGGGRGSEEESKEKLTKQILQLCSELQIKQSRNSVLDVKDIVLILAKLHAPVDDPAVVVLEHHSNTQRRGAGGDGGGGGKRLKVA